MQPEIVTFFFDCLSHAKKHGLHFEFVGSFFDDLGITDEKLREAMTNAIYEWDM